MHNEQSTLLMFSVETVYKGTVAVSMIESETERRFPPAGNEPGLLLKARICNNLREIVAGVHA